MKYGLLNLYKPIGPTSRDCVNQIVKRLKQEKVAHAGTLDPLAQGVLLILVGPAVRLMEEIHQLDKEYIATFRLGERSPSGDLETQCEPIPIPAGVVCDTIEKSMKRFVGEIHQIPPAYSAIRVDGKRAHKSARRGATPQIPPRKVTIHALELLESSLPELRLRIQCSTGTYIRTLGSDLAKTLGTDAVMTNLVRMRVGPFESRSAVRIESIADSNFDQILQPAGRALPHWEHWSVDDLLMRRILDGQRLTSEEVPSSTASRLAVFDSKNVLRATLLRYPDGTWRCEKGIAHYQVLP